MTRLRFDDGVEFDTDGPYRIEERHDGLYVVGRGMLCPCDSREAAERLLADLKKKESN
jgi:hypothetical protein